MIQLEIKVQLNVPFSNHLEGLVLTVILFFNYVESNISNDLNSPSIIYTVLFTQYCLAMTSCTSAIL